MEILRESLTEGASVAGAGSAGDFIKRETAGVGLLLVVVA